MNKSIFFICFMALSMNLLAAEPQCSSNSNVEQRPYVVKTSKLNDKYTELNFYCGNNSSVQNMLPSQREAETKKEDTSSLTFRIIDLLVKLSGALAWPLAVILISFSFKKELSGLLSRLKKGKWGSTEFEFENYIRAVDAETDLEVQLENKDINPATAAQASKDPRGAILTAWIEIENALFNLVKVRNLEIGSSRQKGVLGAVRAVSKAQALAPTYISLLQDLRVMRNEAAHAESFNPTPDSVITYVQLANELISAINNSAYNPNFPLD